MTTVARAWNRFDSRVKAMELDERPTEEYSDIGGLDKQIEEVSVCVCVCLCVCVCACMRYYEVPGKLWYLTNGI